MKMKKALACIVASFSIISSLSLQVVSSVSGTSDTGSDDGKMRSSITAQRFAEEMGLGINLGNTMEAYDATNCESASYKWPPIVGNNKPENYEKVWGAVETTQKVIDGMKDAGFKTVRIPVFWGNMMKNDGTFTISDEYIGRVKEIVDYCRNDGLYTVINIHHFDEFIIRRYSKEKCVEIFTNLWTQIANYFKDYSDYLVFEGFNEYLGGGQIGSNGKITDLPRDEGYDWTNKMNQAFVSAVRATGGNNANRMLVVSGYWTNIDLTTNSNFKIPTDTVKDRLMVSVHYVDNSMYWTNQIGNENWKTYSINQCNLLKKAFSDKGIPVFIGETTSVYPSENFAGNATVKKSSDALDYILRLITSYDFVPVLWDTNNNFYSRTQYKIKSSTDSEVIKNLSKEIEPAPTQPSEPSSEDTSASPDPTKTSAEPKPTKNIIGGSSNTLSREQIVKRNKNTVQKAMKQAKITKLTVKSKSKKKINVSWKKVKKAKGYQVQVSTNKKFKKSKIIFKKDVKKTKLTIKNKRIKSKKTYFVRVRAFAAYKDTNNKTIRVYSKWNKQLRKVKTK